MVNDHKNIKFGNIDILMILCTIIWGANYAAMKFVMHGINAMAMNAVRLILSALVMIIYLVIARRGEPIAKHDRLRFAFGGIILLVYHFAYLFGIKGTLSWKASIMMGTMPIFVTLFSFILKDEIASFIVWMGVIMSFIGLLMLMKGQISWDALVKSDYFLGDLISLGAAMLWAAFTLTMKPLLEKYSPFVVSTYPLIFVSFAFFFFSIPQLKSESWRGIGLAEMAIIFLSGLFSIAIGSIIWYSSVKLAGNIRTSVYSNFTPVWAMLVSLFILMEKLGIFELIGSILVMAGVALSKFKIEMPGLKKNKHNKTCEVIR
jgi:drug/metabolite transporter (DMT)-like permease